MNPSYPRPDFVLFGIQDGYGGVILFASTDLRQAELESKVLGLQPTFIGRHLMRLEDRRTTLRCELGQFTMIRADTYIEALHSLMTTWKPPEPPNQLTAG